MMVDGSKGCRPKRFREGSEEWGKGERRSSTLEGWAF